MSSLAFLQCSSGVSGDMLLGALVDLGVEGTRLEGQLRGLNLPGFRLDVRDVQRQGIRAKKVTPRFEGKTPLFSTLGQVKELLRASSLDRGIVREAEKVFLRIAEAEATVHGKTAGTVHFHELGSPDTIIDVVGTIIGWRELGISSALATAVNVGSGSVRTSHGVFPVPAPATAVLLRGWPVYSDGEEGEKTTPTGAALLTHLCRPAGSLPPLRLANTGRGAGDREFTAAPNCLHVLLGVGEREVEGEEAVVIEANLDDISPQIFGYLTARLLKGGAMDAYVTPVVMKKGRPGHLVTVVAAPERVESLGKILFNETATLGYRTHRVGRLLLRREVKEVDSPGGRIRVKTASLDGKEIRYAPEYEDCRRIAEKSGRPLREIIEEVIRDKGRD